MARNILLLGIALVLLATSAAASNLVLNGGFTTTDFTDWSTTACDSSGCTVAGWAVMSIPAGILGAAPPSATYAAATGCTGAPCNATSGATPHGDTIFQTLSTTAGQAYTLTFYYDPGDHVVQTGQVTELDVLWNGVSQGQLIDETANTWALYTFNVTAAASSTVLEFTGRSDPNDLYLTDVSVTPEAGPTVPEPVSLTLIGGGLLGIGAIGAMLRRRRKV